jgi:hypothetical protein
MIALSRVHALFSHYEDFLRQGYLLPGPWRHKWSKDQPAYEFPTGDAGARVLARKLCAADRWLITAWAAAGEEREVTVDIPLLGQVALPACPGGSVYEAVRDQDKPKLQRVDVASTDRRQVSSCAD